MSKKISLNDLNIISDAVPGMERASLANRALDSAKKIMSAFLPNSGYTITLSGLNRSEMRTLSEANMNGFQYRDFVYRLIHTHIVNTSIGILSYDEFCKLTSFSDFQTLCYLIYSSTFKTSGKYVFTCPTCQTKQKITVDNNNIAVIDFENYEALKLHYNHINSKFDLVNDKNEKDITSGDMLPSSKIVLKIKSPSLQQSLDVLKYINADEMLEDSNFVLMSMYIDKVYIPSGEKYVIEEDRPKIHDILQKLEADDILSLNEILLECLEKEDVISYELKKIKCSDPDCEEEFDNVQISLENMLFQSAFATIQLLPKKME